MHRRPLLRRSLLRLADAAVWLLVAALAGGAVALAQAVRGLLLEVTP